MGEYEARPTTYKGVKMRSRLEAGFAMWLDSKQAVWEYEPQAFAGEGGQYLPDFVVYDVALPGELVHAYVEVKPVPPDSLTGERLPGEGERRMAIIWESKPDAALLYAWPEGIGVLHRLDASLAHIGPAVAFPYQWVRRGSPGIALAGVSASGPWQGEWWGVQ